MREGAWGAGLRMCRGDLCACAALPAHALCVIAARPRMRPAPPRSALPGPDRRLYGERGPGPPAAPPTLSAP